MKLAFNIFLFFLIAFSILQSHFVIAGVAVLIFTYRCGAGFLVPLAFLIDGYFGAFYHIPVISIASCVWFFISELIRPRLLLQYQGYEKTS